MNNELTMNSFSCQIGVFSFSDILYYVNNEFDVIIVAAQEEEMSNRHSRGYHCSVRDIESSDYFW